MPAKMFPGGAVVLIASTLAHRLLDVVVTQAAASIEVPEPPPVIESARTSWEIPYARISAVSSGASSQAWRFMGA